MAPYTTRSRTRRPGATNYNLLVDAEDVVDKCKGCAPGITADECMQPLADVHLSEILDKRKGVVLETAKGTCYDPEHISKWWQYGGGRIQHDEQTRLTISNRAFFARVLVTKKSYDFVLNSIEDIQGLQITFNGKDILSELARISAMENTDRRALELKTVAHHIMMLAYFLGSKNDVNPNDDDDNEGEWVQYPWFTNGWGGDPRMGLQLRSWLVRWHTNNLHHPLQYLQETAKRWRFHMQEQTKRMHNRQLSEGPIAFQKRLFLQMPHLPYPYEEHPDNLDVEQWFDPAYAPDRIPEEQYYTPWLQNLDVSFKIIQHRTLFMNFSDGGAFALRQAVIMRNVKEVERLLLTYPEAVDIKLSDGFGYDCTPLFLATTYHQPTVTVRPSLRVPSPQIAKLLLQHGADVTQATDFFGRTALYELASQSTGTVHDSDERELRIIETVLLLLRLPYTKIEDWIKTTPRIIQDDYLCPEHGPYEFAEHMLSGVNRGNVWYKYGLTALQVAILTWNLTIIDELLIITGGSSVSRKQDGMTELHITALTGNSDTMFYVLDILDNFGNYSVNVKDLKGRTPLHFAMRIGNTLVVKMLLNRGADLYTRDVLGASSLDVAMWLNDPEMMKTLQNKILDSSSNEYDRYDRRISWFTKWVYGIPGQKPLGNIDKPPIEFSIFGGVPPGPRTADHRASLLELSERYKNMY